MSPEQACGDAVDRRADIWSFGAVLYEALSGKRAFPGMSVSDTVASVLKLEPDWKALPADTPAPIRKLVERCLKKDRRQRLQAIGDARIEIEEVLAGDSANTLPSRSRTVTAGWIASGLLAAALAVVGVTHFKEASTRTAAPVRFAFSLPDGVAFNNSAGTLAVSPDGKYGAVHRSPVGRRAPPLRPCSGWARSARPGGNGRRQRRSVLVCRRPDDRIRRREQAEEDCGRRWRSASPLRLFGSGRRWLLDAGRPDRLRDWGRTVASSRFRLTAASGSS